MPGERMGEEEGRVSFPECLVGEVGIVIDGNGEYEHLLLRVLLPLLSLIVLTRDVREDGGEMVVEQLGVMMGGVREEEEGEEVREEVFVCKEWMS